MLRRSILFLLCAGTAFAQPSNRPIVRSADDSTVHSIIVKFRSAQAMSDASILAKLQAVSSVSDVMRPVFRRPPSKNSVQSISIDPVGIERIIRIPLREGMSATDAVRSLSGMSAIEYAEPNYFYHIQRGLQIPNDPLYYAQWWLQSVHAPQAWEITEGDSSIHIGFVDTGVDWLHPDLVNQFAVDTAEDINHNGLFDAWPSDSVGMDAHGHMVHGDIDGIDHNHNGYVNDVIGYDFVDQESVNVGDWSGRDPIPQDENGHGTAMAGILAAQQNNNIGISGIAPKCKLVALRAFDANGTGEDDDIASAIVYAADNNVRILSLSFGDIIPSLLQRDAIRYAISKGVIIFGSSGNDGSTGPNYPSDFDEVVSVGGSAPQGLYIYTTHGEELDVVAPGQNVYTTKLGGGYDSVSGTSASSPISAGIAALLLSKNPNLTPIELRSIIESTTKTVGDRSHSANGQVDAFAALSYPGSATIKMVTPHTLDEFHVGDTIPIMGDAMSTLFTGYSLSWLKDYQKDSLGFDQVGNPVRIFYDSIVGAAFDTSNSQVLNGALGTLDTHGFDTGTYSITLSVGSNDNRSTQERCNIYMAKARPRFVLFSIDSIWVNTERGLLVQATTDIPAQFVVRYSAPGASNSTIADDKIGSEHAILIKREQAQAVVPLTIDAMLITPNGDTTKLDTVAMIPNEAVAQFPQGGFIQKPYALPPGFALDSVLSIPRGDQVIENPYTSGLLTVFQFDSATMSFKAIDSVSDPSIPQAIGNPQSDGRPELLVQSADNCNWHLGQLCGTTRVYKQNAAHSILGDIVFENDTLFGSTFAALDTPNKQDIVGVIDSEWMAYQYSGGNYSILGSAVNPSNPDHFLSQIMPPNNYSASNVKHADLRGSGVEDLVTLDDDADLIIYERDATTPSGFRAVFIDSNNAVSSGSLLAIGDFDGDGKSDIAYAFHPWLDQDTLDEYHPSYFTVKVLRNLGGMKFETMTTDHFYSDNQNDHAYDISGRSSSLGRISNVTGGKADDLALSFFPNFYLLEFDSSSKQMRPIWNYPVSQSPRGAISWDFDKNGKREFGFFTGDSIHFFEHSDSYTEQTPAPAGLNVSPRDTNRVDLQWAPVEHATEYYILRAAPQDVGFTIIDSTQSTFYSDTTVSNGDIWIYSVRAFAPPYTIPVSQHAFGYEILVHPMPRLVSAAMQSQNNIKVRTSQPPRTNRLFAGTIMVDDSVASDAITMSSDSELIMEIANSLSEGTHRMRVTSFNLRDIYNSPFDTTHYLSFQVQPDTAISRFYIFRWTFAQGLNGLQIHVIFNEQPGASALDVLHYSLSPYGTLTSVSRDTANPNALYIDVQGVQLVALGVPFVLCVTNITSVTNTALDATDGNCAGISLVEPDLSNVMVYPNPAKQSLGQLTFARLTSNAQVRIYTLRMKPIRVLSISGSEGGVVWDLLDDAGNAVPSGEYLYYVTGSNEAGVSVQGIANKLVIVNDQK
jgi:subtilisin family serine protease